MKDKAVTVYKERLIEKNRGEIDKLCRAPILSIVIPTFNECANLNELLPTIHQRLTESQITHVILVVDDDSCDGTEELITQMNNTSIQLIVRKGKRGLSSAVYEGMLAVSGEIVCMMDADFSHPPEALVGMYAKIASGEADLVVGSRLVKGGGMDQWPWTRRVTSWVARMMARPLTSVRDITSGFMMMKRDVFPRTGLNLEGFKIGLEIVVKGRYQTLFEYPIIFHDRRYGESKLSGKVMREYLKQLFQLYVFSLFLKYNHKSGH